MKRYDSLPPQRRPARPDQVLDLFAGYHYLAPAKMGANEAREQYLAEVALHRHLSPVGWKDGSSSPIKAHLHRLAGLLIQVGSRLWGARVTDHRHAASGSASGAAAATASSSSERVRPGRVRACASSNTGINTALATSEASSGPSARMA